MCRRCARRAWLFDRLGVRLDFKAHDLARLWSLLELGDRELIDALAGRWRRELMGDYACWEPQPLPQGDDVEGCCRHHCAFPERLREDPLAAHAICALGAVAHWQRLSSEKVVAIVGTRRASDYGLETARALARSLAATGVIVASNLAEGIPAAVHMGALEASAGTLAVVTGNIHSPSSSWRSLYRDILEQGCAIAEISWSPRIRRWSWPASARTLTLLADLVIVVEADERPWELACAQVARARGIPLGAVPGRVSSPASRGTNALLAERAHMVRHAQDALDALYGAGVHEMDLSRQDTAGGSAMLDGALADVLERVGRGEDTVEKLAARGPDIGELALSLVELELRGLLSRGDAGRYLPSGEALGPMNTNAVSR